MKKQSKKKMFKKPLAVVLATAMVLSGIQDSRAYALTPAVTQENEKDVVVLDVNNAEDFVALKSAIEQYDKDTTGRIEIDIKSDIDLTAVTNWQPIDVKTPSIVLSMSSTDQCSISNLTIKSDSNAGIFGELKCSAQFDKLDFINIKVSATGSNAGTIAGKISGEDATFDMINIIQPTIENANDSDTTNIGGAVGYISSKSASVTDVKTYNNIEELEDNDDGTGVGVIKGANYVGGIVGRLDCGDITSCENRVSITGIAASNYVGGIVGYLGTDLTVNNKDTANIYTSTNYGEVVGNTNVGGVVGSIDQSGSCGTESKTANYGKVTGSKNVGGIVGSNAGKISADEDDTSVHNYGEVACGELSINVGGVCGLNTGTITNAKNSANVTGGVNVGGIAGKNEGEIKNCTNNTLDLNDNEIAIKGKENVGGIAGDNAGSVINSKNGADVIGNKNVGGITGINSTEDSVVKGCTNQGDVKGVEITENGETIPSSNVGGISGENNGTISKSTNNGKVSGDNNVGGIAGSNKGDIKDNCVNNGDVTGKENVGGIAGENQGNISDAKNTGSVTGDKNVGGIAGKNEGNISKSENTGNVTGTDETTTGGLVGVNETPEGDDSNITDCTNTGDVNGEPASDDKNIGQIIKKEPEPTQTPSQEPSQEPSQAPTQEPTEAPTEEPTEAPTQAPGETTESPEPTSSEAPSQSPEASTNPSQTPDASTNPSASPSATPSASPSATPNVSPSPTPGANGVQYGTPSYNTGGTNVINYITNPTSATWDKQVRFGYIFTVGNYTYRITKSTLIGDAVNTVEVYRVANRGLKTIQIKNQVKLGTQFYNIVAIRNDVAKKYGPVKKVVIGDKVTKIGSRAFMGCKKLTSVSIDSKKLTKIGTNAFSGCKKLKKVVIVSSKVKSVGKNAFKNTSKKLVIDVPNKKVKKYKKVFAKSGKAKKAVIK